MPISFTAASSERRGFQRFAPGIVLASLFCALVACAGRSASASTFQINVAATNLTASTNYGLSFELQNGVLVNPLQARIRNFSLVGGTLGSGGSSMGSNPAAGSLDGTLSLATNDLSDLSDYVQNFTSSTGSAVMAFTLDLSSTTPELDPSAPDFFRFSFLGSNGIPVSTTAADNISLAYAEFSNISPSVQTFRTANFNTPNPTGPRVAAQIQPSAAPEPGTLLLVLPSGAGIGGAVWLHGRRKRAFARA